MGEEYFQEVSWVFFQHNNPKIPPLHDPAAYEAVTKLDTVEVIYTLGYPIDNADFARIMAIPRLREARLLDLEITEAGLDALEFAPAIEGLTILSAPGNLSGRGLVAIARQPRLKDLDLLNLDFAGPDDLAPLAKLSHLESLSLKPSPHDDRCLQHLKDLKSLKQLDLRTTWLTDSGVDALAKLDRLEIVRFDGSKLTEVGLAKLAAIPTLKKILLEPLPRLNDACLASLDKLNSLPTLCLTASDVTDAGLTHLKGLELDRMTVSGLGVTDVGIDHLVKANEIQELDLSRTSVTGSGLKALKNRPGLSWLSLDRTRVDDTGAATLATLQTRFLSLDETSITDATLNALQQNKTLVFLRVRGTKVTPEGLEAFQKARPGVVVKSGPIEPISGR